MTLFLSIPAVLLPSLPWLNPFASGPSSAVVPWLVSLTCVTLLFFVWRHIRTVDIAASLCIAALLSAVLGLIQYFGFSDSFSPWINHTAPGEAFANLRQRNQFASLTNIGLIALIWLAGGHGASRGGWMIAAAGLLAVGNAASSSRTGLLQLLMLALLVAWWGGLRQGSARRLMLAAGLAYAIASVVLPLLIGLEFGGSGILGRLNDGGAACGSRLVLWRNVLDLIALKPWLGWGWGELDYAHFVTLYPGGPDARFCEILDNAHNLPLHLAVELGLPVALAVCGLGTWLIWRAKPWLEQDATRQMAWGVLAVILLHSLLEYPLWYGPFQMAFGLCVWLLMTTPAQLQDLFTTNVVKNDDFVVFFEIYEKFKPLAHVFIRFIAILIIVFITYAGWDYHRISQIYRAPEQRSEAYRTDTLGKIQGSWLFKNQVRFAELTTTPVTSENAANINAMAHDVLHFSPEVRVVEKLIDSAVLLGRHVEARFYAARYRAAYPAEYENWLKAASPAR
jgi:O-antigen ligase